MREARALLTLDSGRMRRVVWRYIITDISSVAMMLVSLYLLIPILRSVGGRQASFLEYDLPIPFGFSTSLTLHWTVPFAFLVLATWFATRAKRVEYGLWRDGAKAARRQMHHNAIRGVQAPTSLPSAERIAKAAGVAARWYSLLLAQCVRLVAIVVFMVVAYPWMIPITSSIALVALAYRWRQGRRRLTTREAREDREEGPLDARIAQRVDIFDTRSAFSLTAPATVLVALIVNRLAPSMLVDASALLILYAAASTLSGALAEMTRTGLRLAGRPDWQRTVMERLVGGDSANIATSSDQREADDADVDDD